MTASGWSKGILCGLALLLMAGCQTYPNARQLRIAPVVPAANEEIVRDQLIIIVDVTGSIGSGGIYKHEKALAEAFTAGMPDGTYWSGLDSFAGVPSHKWVLEPLARYNRQVMVDAADRIEPLGSLTPLERAIRSQRIELQGNRGRAALLIFSDGQVVNHEYVLQACRDLKVSHGGELCIYTVQVGSSASGRQLLQEMAAVNGCGKYYDGDTLTTQASIEGLVRDVFFGPRQVAQPAPQAAAPAPVTVVWRINNILFDNDKSVILPKYQAVVDEAASMMSANPAMRLRLDGHTDSNASVAYNQKLSERRVEAVRAALVSRGVDATRLDIVAHGKLNPAVPNTTPENMHLNRRVELTVID
jgi:OmpA-OmpF porin, OOP family